MITQIKKYLSSGVIRSVALCLLLVFLALMAFYTRDLTQDNPESIFLTKSGLSDYKKFSKKVYNPQILIVKINFDDKINSADIKYVEEEIKKIRISYGTQVKILDYKSIYKNTNLFVADSEAINYFSSLNKGVRFLGQNFISIILIERTFIPKKLIKDFDERKFFNKKEIRLKIAGHAYTNYLLDMNSKDIKDILFPLMFIFAFFILLYINQNIFQTIIIFFPGILSALLGLTSIKYMFVNMNMITSIIPLLLFVINISLSLHLFFGLIEYRKFSEVLRLKLKPLFLMVLTTSVGFGSLLISEIVVIKQFAFLSSTLIGISGVITLLWFVLTKDYLKKSLSKNQNIKRGELVKNNFFKKGLKPSYIYILSFVFLSLSYLVIEKISIITDATLYFSEKSKFKDDIDEVATTVSGVPLYEVILKSNKGEFDYEELSQIHSLEKKVENIVLKDQYIISMNTLVQDISYHYTKKNQFPSMKFTYFPMRSALDEDMKKAYPLGKYYRMTIVGKALNSDIYLKNLKEIKKYLDSSDQFKYQINGLYYNLMNSQEAMVTILAKSFLLSLIIVCLIAFIYYRSMKILWIFFLVNTIPVSITVFLIYLFDLSLNIATVMTFSISMGMIVDSSLHIIHILDQKRVTYNTYFKTTVIPVVLSSFLFILCFSSFSIMGFLPIRQFGIILSIMLFLGLIFDLYVLPSLYIGSEKIDSHFNKKKI